MQLTAQNLTELASLATQAAVEAGALIARYSQREVAVQHKSGADSLAAQVVTEVDELSQSIILRHLEPSLAAYDLALLSEECRDDGSRHLKDYFWCIDPLDGTLPFTQRMPGYSVSIALVSRTGVPQIGVIYDPIQQVLYSAVLGQGLWRNGQPWSTSSTLAQPVNQSLRFYCDCTFYSQPDGAELIEQMQLLASELGYAELLVKQGGGGVLNACRVLENAPACYFKKPKLQAGGGSLWDFAATACLFKQAAAPVSDFNGQPLDLNRRDSSFMNHRGVIYSSCWQLSAALQKL
jgi:myo-inositol-1(or 4)-monophosphatase